MFLVKDSESDTLVFLAENPHYQGFTGDVEMDVTFIEPDDLNIWIEAREIPEPCVGRSPMDPKEYRAFKNQQECREAGYEFLGTSFLQSANWLAYKHRRGLA